VFLRNPCHSVHLNEITVFQHVTKDFNLYHVLTLYAGVCILQWKADIGKFRWSTAFPSTGGGHKVYGLSGP